MKAIVCTKYGSPDVLRLEEVEKPAPKEGEVLLAVHAASINAGDLETLRGDWPARFGGLLRPAHRIPGTDVAGRVEAVGRDVKRFEIGDQIFGTTTGLRSGANAEYICLPEE